MRIELFYFDGCPGYAELRARLPHLLERASVDAEIVECRIDSEQAARRERFLGSPTLRVDGRDVEVDASTRQDCGMKCRLYDTTHGLLRTPPDTWITATIRAALTSEQTRAAQET
ncbi:MAG: hypothetical protein WBV85_03270 [Solirubrobacteraceae bacterium]